MEQSCRVVHVVSKLHSNATRAVAKASLRQLSRPAVTFELITANSMAAATLVQVAYEPLMSQVCGDVWGRCGNGVGALWRRCGSGGSIGTLVGCEEGAAICAWRTGRRRRKCGRGVDAPPVLFCFGNGDWGGGLSGVWGCRSSHSHL
eukprot:179130-Chlamydomonas_euryale.AAC.5